MQRLLRIAAIGAVAALVLAACGGGGSDDSGGGSGGGGSLPACPLDALNKALGGGNKLENIPEMLVSYTSFIKSDASVKWIGW